MVASTFFTSYGMDQNPDQYLFSGIHFLYIALCIIGFFVLMKLFLPRSEKTKKRFIMILLVLMLLLKYGGEIIFISEYLKYGTSISSFSHPFWDFRTFISFQLCGVNNILLPIVYWFNIKRMKDFVYTTSIIGGIAVLLYPVGVLYGEPLVLTYLMLRSLIVHFLLVFIPCFLIADKQFTLEGKNWKNTFFGAVLMAAWAMVGNLFIDPTANNMYMMENPFYGGPIPILNILPNGWHMIALSLMVVIGFWIVYQITFLYQRQRDK